MKKRITGIFGGILLVGAGLVSLALSRGLLTETAPELWAAVFAVISVLSLAAYFVSGIQNWAILLPAGAFGGLALLMAMASNHVDSPVMVAPLFAGIGIPFVVAYHLNRSVNWWALIPAGVMAFLTFTMLVAERFAGEIVGSGLFFILSATFALVYFSGRKTWAAIPAYVMFILGFMPLMAMSPRPELSSLIILFGVALPFLTAYLRSPDEKFWAIIPGGIILTTGVMTGLVLAGVLPEHGTSIIPANAIMYAGIAGTFAIVWLRHHKPWGKTLTILAALAATANLFGGTMGVIWPALMVLAGCYFLYKALRPENA